MRSFAVLFLFVSFVPLASAAPPAPKLAPQAWQARQEPIALARLLVNVSPANGRRGAIVAAPSGNPDYQFHWTRDAAVTMSEILAQAKQAKGPLRAKYLGMYKAYARFSWRTMRVSTLTGLGEPKFTMKGAAWNGDWGRPQSDGPGTRALGNIAFARELLGAGEGRYVRKNLFDVHGSRPRGTLIRSDLDYIVSHWREPSFDIWEEEHADHFYTRAVQYKALVEGAELAHGLGDLPAEARYRRAAGELGAALDRHWDPESGIMRTSINRQADGAQHKLAGLDSAVILAVNHTYGASARVGVLDERILATAARLEHDFAGRYEINRGKATTAIGRYPEDRYTGLVGHDKEQGGNAWVITTNGFAEYYFRVAHELGERELQITPTNRAFFLAALGERAGSSRLPVGSIIGRGQADFGPLRRALVERGDGFLATVQQHANPDGSQNEQIDRDTGKMRGATELTWNYASFLSAMRARREL